MLLPAHCTGCITDYINFVSVYFGAGAYNNYYVIAITLLLLLLLLQACGLHNHIQNQGI